MTLAHAFAPAPLAPAPDLAAALAAAHQALAAENRHRLAPRLPGPDDRRRLRAELAVRELELDLLDAERRAVAARAASSPVDPDAFVRWFAALREDGPGQGDALFPWLATRATRAELMWFLAQEVAGEAGFEDLVALAQIKLPTRPKLELARNYWDEMGQGVAKGTHGGMLATLARELDLHAAARDVAWESLAVGNLMLAMAGHRAWAYHCLGALGAIELTAPTRVGHVHAALARLGLAPRGRKYFAVHATLDVRHSQAWNREVVRPLAERRDVALALAEGALIRLGAGARAFERYRRELDVSDSGDARLGDGG